METTEFNKMMEELGPLLGNVTIDVSEDDRILFIEFEDGVIRIDAEPTSDYVLLSSDVSPLPEEHELMAMRTLLYTNGLSTMNEGTWFGLEGDSEIVSMHFRISLAGQTPQSLYRVISWFKARVEKWVTIIEQFGTDEQPLSPIDMSSGIFRA